MTRNQADELSQNLVGLMLDMEDDLLHLVGEQLAHGGEFSDTSKWRIRQLARAGLMDKKAAKLIASYTGIQSEMLRVAVENAAYTEMGYVDTAVRDLQRKGLLSGASDLPAEDSAMFAYRAYLEQAETDLNMVNTVMLYNTKKAYVNAVNRTFDVVQEAERNHGLYAGRVHDALGKYTGHTVAGTMSLQEATRRCIKELSERGIPAFIDHSGREWSPEAYVTMDLRSTLGNTARAAQNMRCDQYGIKLIEVSSHLGARPLCAPYQGRIFSRDGRSGTTTDGDGHEISYSPLEDTSYGQPAGLFGINCGHVQYPFVAGCSFQTYFPYDAEENAERYKEFQKQRYMERQIRNTKRECMMYNSTGDKDGFEKAALRLRNQKEKYKDFSSAHGLGLHNDRTQVVGFDRSVSSKASWAARKAEAAKAAPSGSHGSAAPAEISIKGGANGGTGKTYTEQNISQKGLTGGRKGGIMKDSGDTFYPVSDNAYGKITSLNVFGDERDSKMQEAMKHVLDNVKDKSPGTECLALYSHKNMSYIDETISEKSDGVVKALTSDKPFVSIHNHASRKTFSSRDVRRLYEDENCKGIFVTGNDGSMYGLVKTSEYDKTGLFEYIMKRRMGYISASDEEFVKGCEAYGTKYYRRADQAF